MKAFFRLYLKILEQKFKNKNINASNNKNIINGIFNNKYLKLF